MGSRAQVQQLKNPDKDDPWDGVSDRQDCAVWFPRLGPWCQNLLISSWALELHLSLYLVSLSLSLSLWDQFLADLGYLMAFHGSIR